MLSPEFIGGSEDPVALVESCYRAVEMLLATHTANAAKAAGQPDTYDATPDVTKGQTWLS